MDIGSLNFKHFAAIAVVSDIFTFVLFRFGDYIERPWVSRVFQILLECRMKEDLFITKAIFI